MDSADDIYTHGHHPAVLASHQWRTAQNSAGYLLERLRPGLRLLDVGCGAGTITADLARLVAPGTVLGVDREPAVLEVAREACRDLGNVTIAPADVYRLEVPDEAFDIVHAHQVLQHLSDPVAALREMRRVTAVGGMVAARDADFAAMAYFPRLAGLDEFFDVYHRVARANGAEPDAGRHLADWARQAGFTQVECSASSWCFATPGDREWWGGTWAQRATESAVAFRARDLGIATQADLEGFAAAWRQWSAHPAGWFAVLHGEILAHRTC